MIGTPASRIAVEFKSVSKRFGAVQANRDVTFRVNAQEIHAIVGENGAGKSTAMNLLYGMSEPTSGEISVFGKTVSFRNPLEAIAMRIGMVHQHFMLSRPHTVLENIIVGAEPTSAFGRIDREEARAKVEAHCKHLGFDLDLDASIESLSVGAEQRVEILKALYRNATVLILDEPTAVLTPQEVSNLFVNLKRMRDDGMTIVLITHKLKEVMDIADRITVFRRGEVTGTFARAETTIERLAEEMVGRKVNLPSNDGVGSAGEPVLELKGEFTFSLRRGEILGIAGVEGNGQGEIVEQILGFSSSGHPRGSVSLNGRSLDAMTVKERFEAGISCIPEDRHEQGVALSLSVFENFLLGQEPAFSSKVFGVIDRERVLGRLMEWAKEFDIRPPNPHLPMRSFSGGNQQKWVVARELERKPKVLIAAQPTRGVDIGAIERIHGRLLREKSEGTAILLVSSELDEILHLADRILVLYRGKIVGEHRRGEVDELRLGAEMGGKTAAERGGRDERLFRERDGIP